MNLDPTYTEVHGNTWIEINEDGIIEACYTDKDWAIAEIKEQQFFMGWESSYTGLIHRLLKRLNHLW